MTTSQSNIFRFTVRDLRHQAERRRKCGRVEAADRLDRRADTIEEVVKQLPPGCGRCAYQGEESERCDGCKRQARPDLYTRKYVNEVTP